MNIDELKQERALIEIPELYVTSLTVGSLLDAARHLLTNPRFSEEERTLMKEYIKEQE
jgi:hypothetical protein